MPRRNVWRNTLRGVLAALAALGAYANSIDVRITPDRKAEIHERFSGAAPVNFVYLDSPCVRIGRIQADGRLIEPQGAGPWRTVASPALEISYEAVPVAAARACPVSLLMPDHPVGPVSVTVTDLGSGLRFISVPHFAADPGSKIWTANFPAVPSILRLEWKTGSPPGGSTPAPAGRFALNFWGLCAVLVIWTAAYLLWARRDAS